MMFANLCRAHAHESHSFFFSSKSSRQEQKLDPCTDDSVRVIRLRWVRPVTQIYLFVDGVKAHREREKQKRERDDHCEREE